MKLRLQPGKSTSEEYHIVGISSSLADYQLSHILNKQLSIDLRRLSDIPLYNKTGLIGRFPFYSFFEENLKLSHFLLGNKYNNKIAIQEFRHFEFFVLLQISSYSLPLSDLLIELRSINKINAALNIPIAKLLAFEEIMEDIELHLLESKPKTQADAMAWLWNKS
jgi:hypothetical protein